MTNRAWFVILFYSLLGIYACSPGRKISREASSILLTDSVIARGHLASAFMILQPGNTFTIIRQTNILFLPATPNCLLFTPACNTWVIA
jgi:hypothetical protein